MKMAKRLAAFVGTLGAALLFAAPVAAEPTPLFTAGSAGGKATLNPGALNADVIKVVLPDGSTVLVRQQNSSTMLRGARTWTGAADGEPGSLLSLASARGFVTGVFAYGGKTWEIMPSRGGHTVVVSTEARPDGVDMSTPLTAPSPYEATSITDSSGDTVVDVLVFYTPATKLKYKTIESMVVNAVAAANQAHENSGTGTVLRLVGLEELPGFVESGTMQGTLNYFRGTADGVGDSVHARRDELGADLVSLISMDTDYCGMAGVLPILSTDFASHAAFSVVRASCLSRQTLAHELGHNMGSRHDRKNSSAAGVFPYSYGYTDCATFHTIMSYSCGSAPRRAFFSNPSILFNGVPMGVDHEVSPLTSADNARSMRQAVATVAAFRPAVLPPTHDLIIRFSGSGSVAISSPAKVCRANCTTTYPAADEAVVTLTAKPLSTTRFVGWSGYCTDLSPTCVVPMTARRIVTATFIKL